MEIQDVSVKLIFNICFVPLIIDNITKIIIEANSSSPLEGSLLKAIHIYNSNSDLKRISEEDLKSMKIFKSKTSGLPNFDNEVIDIKKSIKNLEISSFSVLIETEVLDLKNITKSFNSEHSSFHLKFSIGNEKTEKKQTLLCCSRCIIY